MPPKQNIPNVIGVPDNDDLRIMFNQIGTAIDNANANIGLLATQNQNLIQALAPHVADIANAVQNPVGLAGIEASLRHSSRPTLGPYTLLKFTIRCGLGRPPLTKIQGWSFPGRGS